MSNLPLQKVYGTYSIVFRKADHTSHSGGRGTPHVEVYKGGRKVGNYDMATGSPLPGSKPVHKSVLEFLRKYLKDPVVQKKVSEAIELSFFDLSKPAGQYGAVPKGFSAKVVVDIVEQ